MIRTILIVVITSAVFLVSPAAAVTWQDNFDDGDISDWTETNPYIPGDNPVTFEPSLNEFTTTPFALRVNGPNADYYGGSIEGPPAGINTAEPYTIEFDFRYDSVHWFYLVAFDVVRLTIDQTGLSIVYWDDTGHHFLGGRIFSGYCKPQTWTHFRIQVQPSQGNYIITADEQYVGTVYYGSYQSGASGFQITETGGNAPAQPDFITNGYYDNIIIYSCDGEVPTAQNDYFTTFEDSPLVIHPLINDTDPGGAPLSISFTTFTTAQGTVAIDPGDTTFTYTPKPDWWGIDTFQYVATNGDCHTNVATVMVTVDPTSDPPQAQNDFVVVPVDTTNQPIDILANDSDPDGDALKIYEVDDGSTLGTVWMEPDSSGARYTPLPGYTGPDVFTYSVTDGQELDYAIVTIQVNTAPVASDDLAATLEDIPVDIYPLTNDYDDDGDPLDIDSAWLAPGSGGIVSVSPGGGFLTYTPPPNYVGNQLIKYMCSDGYFSSNTATITVDVVSCFTGAPTAQDDFVFGLEDSSLVVYPLQNDSDPDLDPLTMAYLDTTLTLGSAILDFGDSTFTYTPPPDFFGEDTVRYGVSDGTGCGDAAYVFITVDNVNDPPDANDDVALALQGRLLNIDPLANDTDVDEDPLIVSSLDLTLTAGTVTIAPDGLSVEYTSPVDFVGTDQFYYAAQDPELAADTARVIVEVGVPDPAASSVCLRVCPAGDLDSSAEIIDTNGLPVDMAWVVVDLTSALDSLTFCSGFADTTQSFSLDALGQVQFFLSPMGGAVWGGVEVSVDWGLGPRTLYPSQWLAGLDLNRNGVIDQTDSDTIGVSVLLGLTDDRMNYDCSSPVGVGDATVATPHIIQQHSCLISPPVAVDDSVSTDQDVAVQISVLTNDSDPEGNLLLVESVNTSGTSGGVAIDEGDTTVTYTPAPGFTGSDQFDYTASDGTGGTDQATVYVTVTGDNQPPVAVDDSLSTSEDTSALLAVLQNDSDLDGDPLTITGLDSTGTVGSVSIDTGDTTLTYAPSLDYNGADLFRYFVSDGNGGVDSASVFMTVTPVNDPPVAAADSATTSQYASVVIAVLANDSDVDGDTLTLASLDVTGTVGSAAIETGDTTVVYTPDGIYTGWDSFLYVVADGAGGLDTADVWINVHPDTLLGDTCDDIESGGWEFGHINLNTNCSWTAAYVTGTSHSPATALRTYLSGGGGGQDFDHIFAKKTFPFTVPDPLASVTVWFDLQALTSPGLRAYSYARVTALDSSGAALDNQIYCIAAFDEIGDYENRTGWLYQEATPLIHEPGAPTYARNPDGSIIPATGWWYRLTVHPVDDLSVLWADVDSIRVEVRSGGAYMLGDSNGMYWDDVCLWTEYGPAVTATAPNGGETYEYGELAAITWTATDSAGVDSIGIQLSTDAGQTWSWIVNGEPNDGTYDWTVPEIDTDQAMIRLLAYNPNVLFGMDASDSTFTITPVAGGFPGDGTGSFTFQLMPVFPNPFLGAAHIVFEIPESGPASVRVFDIRGALVRTVVEQDFEPGRYNVDWAGADAAGRSVPPGIYLIQLETGTRHQTRKAIRLR